MYKQNPKSPLAKALKGNQNKLPQHLQDAIKAAPESPAKQKKDKIASTNEKLRKEHAHKSFKAANNLKQGKATDIKDGVELRKKGYNTSLGRPKINIK